MAAQRKSQREKKTSSRIRQTSSSARRKPRHPTTPKTKPREGERVQDRDVELRQGRGSQAKGGMPGGSFWHIYHQGTRVGSVFVNYDGETGMASIQIFLNRKSQSRGIGRIAYRRACEECEHSEVYAFMKRSNIASLRAATAAGFHEVPPYTGQVTMVWKRT